jgi:hypothetical protein
MVYTMIVMEYTMLYCYGFYHDIYHHAILYTPWYIHINYFRGGIYHEATFQMLRQQVATSEGLKPLAGVCLFKTVIIVQ